MLTEHEVALALGHLIGTTTGWTEIAAEEYARELRQLADSAALTAACRSLARSWDEPRRPSLAAILSAYDRERSYRTNEIEPSRVHCDGNGWRQDASGYLQPCPRCNPALAAVFEDDEKHRRWSDGAPLEALEVGVERVGGRLRYTSGLRPPSCSGWDEPIPSFKAGLQQAWAEYSRHCAEHGIQPGKSMFNFLKARLPDDGTTEPGRSEEARPPITEPF